MVINNQNQPYYNWSGWWFFATPLKHDGVKVSWDYDIPNIWKNKKRSKPPTRYDFMIQSDRMVILVEVIGFWIGLIWDFPNKKS